jgi:serine kinase of HPr protein (carbohydrate metabolism regulator)
VFVITKGLTPMPDFIAQCERLELPVLSSSAMSSAVIKRLELFPRKTISFPRPDCTAC